ncbi:hypothetical protein [Flavobacterium columnare]|uniref:hypothetical protein n=2 Tax=Flavobacterium columnare TaxID=996 RepID=UPI00197A8CDC|nr:hypothetical protein [Flavobacterium columnare]
MKKILFLMSFIIFACNSTTKEVNDADDVEKAKELTTSFYSNVKSKNYNTLINILNPNLDSNNLKKLFHSKDSMFGNIEKYDIKDIQTTKITNNGREKTDIIVEVKAYYKNYTFNENLNFSIDTLNNAILEGYHFKTPIAQE